MKIKTSRIKYKKFYPLNFASILQEFAYAFVDKSLICKIGKLNWRLLWKNWCSKMSVADELVKLAKLKEQGIISESEFLQMKQALIRKMNENP